VEAAVNIDAILSGSCQSVSIKTIFVSTKASDSYSAALKDFVDPQPVNFVFGSAGLAYNTPFCKNDANPAPTTPSSPNGTFTGSAGLSINSSTGVINLAATDAGTYTATYTPSGGVCLTPSTAVITVNALPTITGTLSVCEGGTTQLTGSGTAASSTPWVSSNTAVATISNTGLVTGVIAGTSTITYTNSNSCQATATVIVTAKPSQPNVTLVQPTCSNSNGTVTVTSPLSGGGTNYEYSNNGGTYQDAVAFSVASGASYSIVARNKSTLCTSIARTGNMGSASGTPAATAIITQNVDCSHLHGTVKIVQASAGNPAYDNTIYEFSNGGAFGSNPEFTFTAGGGYTLTVRKKSDITCTQSASCAAEAGRLNNSDLTTETSARSLGSASLESFQSDVTVKAMPNPFGNQVRFVINSKEQGDGTLDIFNMLGQKIKTVYQGNIPAGISYFDLKLPSQRGNLVYVLKIGDQKITGKLTQISSN
jgi:hypothetical protein